MQEVTDSIYAMLAEAFDGYYTAEGVFGPFLSGEQVVTRLNTVLGVGAWTFNVINFSHNEKADEVVALGELRALIDGQWVVRQQFGGQKVKRVRDTGMPSNLADDHKGAATDALKKCASMLGVGLYLMVSHATWHQGVPPVAQAAQNARTARSGASKPARRSASRANAQTAPDAAREAVDGKPELPHEVRLPPAIRCMQCDRPLQEVTWPARNGKPAQRWSVGKLRAETLRHQGMVLCAECWREATTFERQQQAAAQAEAKVAG